MRAPMVVAFVACVALLACASVVSGSTPFPYSWETRYFTAQIDNLSFGESGRTFPLKYLINQQYYKPGGPVFFYTGNEAPIELFANNTGFMWDIAPEFGAMLIFAEHRYYGVSLPFGAQSFTNENYVHLSVEQALADYALLLTELKATMPTIADAPVISFGGSYGGMLAAWFRLKYPHITAGAIAGSAPIWNFDSLTTDFDAGSYNRIASQDFRAVSQNCFDQIARSWDVMIRVANQTGGLDTLSRQLGLCPGQLIDLANVTGAVFPWVQNVYSTLPMGDYPYPTTFLGPLPGDPVKVACGFFGNNTQPTPAETIESTRLAMNLFYNGTGQAGQCHSLANENGIATLGAGTEWNYQSCVELVMPIGQYGPPSDMMYVQPWSFADTAAQCQQQFGVQPQRTWVSTVFGGRNDWKDATNIVFSNGNLDPWSGGGVLTNISSTVVAVPVIGGAHHADLRASTPNDPPGFIEARNIERAWIRQFILVPTPSNPTPIIVTQYVDSDSGKLSRTAVALISVFTTLAAALLAFAAYFYCARKQTQTLVDVERRGGSYNTMAA